MKEEEVSHPPNSVQMRIDTADLSLGAFSGVLVNRRPSKKSSVEGILQRGQPL